MTLPERSKNRPRPVSSTSSGVKVRDKTSGNKSANYGRSRGTYKRSFHSPWSSRGLADTQTLGSILSRTENKRKAKWSPYFSLLRIPWTNKSQTAQNWHTKLLVTCRARAFKATTNSRRAQGFVTVGTKFVFFFPRSCPAWIRQIVSKSSHTTSQKFRRISFCQN